ncbi:MAG: hypothetical protein ACK5KO_09100 [Arachnia sp.]
MSIVINLFVLAHLLGLAAVVGSAIFAARGKATPALVWGARAQIITGLVLVGLHMMGGDDINHIKVAVKFMLALVVAACAEIANVRAKKGQDLATLVSISGWVAVLNAAVAVLWTSGS